MALSALDLFSVGIGPSSSHTVGPMRAAKRFTDGLVRDGQLNAVARVRAELFGSLGATGFGHGSDKAVILGLQGEDPETVDTDTADAHGNPLGEDEVRAEIERVHNGLYVAELRKYAAAGGGRIEVDTVLSSESYAVAMMAMVVPRMFVSSFRAPTNRTGLEKVQFRGSAGGTRAASLLGRGGLSSAWRKTYSLSVADGNG